MRMGMGVVRTMEKEEEGEMGKFSYSTYTCLGPSSDSVLPWRHWRCGVDGEEGGGVEGDGGGVVAEDGEEGWNLERGHALDRAC